MRCLLSCNGIERPTTVRQLALGVGDRGADGAGAVCLSRLITKLGPQPRPFYIFGHNPNTIDDVNAALDAGANGIEPDVNIYVFSGRLCISETSVPAVVPGGTPWAPSLEDFLDDLHGVAVRRPQLALVVFDCKAGASTPAHGATLLREIRTRLTHDTNLRVIISTADRQHTGIFDNIRSALGPHEGVMIDSDNSPVTISEWVFADVENQCYGNGVADIFRNPALSPNIMPSIEQACALRVSHGRLKFIYTWSVGFEDREGMREYIRIGTDGIIAGFRPELFDPISVAALREVISEPEFQPLIRLATREDNPFTPLNSAYALQVHTGGDGTDAHVTFTITGKFGSVRKTVNTRLPGRMEKHQWNFITIPSQDLGELETVTVQRDDEGNRPSWYLDTIRVQSRRYGVMKEAVFGRQIDTTNPFTQPLV